MITRDFSVISMTSQASLSLSLLLTKVTHAQYRKRFRASYNNIGSASALPIIFTILKTRSVSEVLVGNKVENMTQFVENMT